MKIAVIGCGSNGVAAALLAADTDNELVVIDNDQSEPCVEWQVKRIIRNTLSVNEPSDIKRRNKSDRKRNRADRWR